MKYYCLGIPGMNLTKLKMNLTKFKSKEILEDKLVADTVSIIQKLQKNQNSLFLLFSGGSTPKIFLQKLSNTAINWTNITISLADERLVDSKSEYSNGKFLFENLINRIKSDKPKFLPLVQDPKNEINNLLLLNQESLFSKKPDIIFLGMGNDGHFASLFPNDNNSEIGLNTNYNEILLNTNAPVHPEKRVSFSLNHIIKSTHLFLFCTGEEKLNIITNTTPKEELPIYNLLESRKNAISVYWAP